MCRPSFCLELGHCSRFLEEEEEDMKGSSFLQTGSGQSLFSWEGVGREEELALEPV